MWIYTCLFHVFLLHVFVMHVCDTCLCVLCSVYFRMPAFVLTVHTREFMFYFSRFIFVLFLFLFFMFYVLFLFLFLFFLVEIHFMCVMFVRVHVYMCECYLCSMCVKCSRSCDYFLFFRISMSAKLNYLSSKILKYFFFFVCCVCVLSQTRAQADFRLRPPI